MKKLLCFVVIALSAISARADIMINEIMQSNIDCTMDDINEFPDSWVELYNSGSEAVNLEGYGLSLNVDFSKAYKLPAVIIGAKSVVLIYCDKNGEGRHADFRLDSGKGALYLFDNAGNQIDALPKIAKQPAPNIAYGRRFNGTETWGYELKPTPGTANGGGHSETILPAPLFSHKGVVWRYNQKIDLSLTLPSGVPSEAVIRYTLDGTEPNASSMLYNAPIVIASSTVVRAKIFSPGCISIPSTTNSYIFMGRDVRIPVISMVTDCRYFYDDKIGILVKGTDANGNPNTENNENFRYNWRRPINLEYFDGEGTEAIMNQLCETRVQGGWTRGANPLKSLAVYANKRFGAKRFAHELWAKDKPGITDNKSFILRNGGNDFSDTYIRDALIQRVIGRNADIDWQGYAPVVVFINGEYHGMLALRERSNDDNIVANYNGLEDIDMFENWVEIKTGTWDNFNSFKNFYNVQHPFDEWKKWLDVEVYTNLMAISCYVYNDDFPHNNIVMWRPAEEGTLWRWLIKDCDFGLGIWDSDVHKPWSDYFKYLLNSVDQSTLIFRNMMKTQEYKEYFVDHMVAYMGDFLNARTFRAYLDEIIEENHGEQNISHKKWGNSWSDLDFNYNYIRQWVDARDIHLPNLLRDNFSLGTPVDVVVNEDLTDAQLEGIELKYAGVSLTCPRFEGKDYTGRTLRLDPSVNSNVTGWKVKVGAAQEVIYDTPLLNIPISSTDKIQVNAITDRSGVVDVETPRGFSVRVENRKIITDRYITVIDMHGRIVAAGSGSVTVSTGGLYVVKSEGCAPLKIAVI